MHWPFQLFRQFYLASNPWIPRQETGTPSGHWGRHQAGPWICSCPSDSTEAVKPWQCTKTCFTKTRGVRGRIKSWSGCQLIATSGETRSPLNVWEKAEKFRGRIYNKWPRMKIELADGIFSWLFVGWWSLVPWNSNSPASTKSCWWLTV